MPINLRIAASVVSEKSHSRFKIAGILRSAADEIESLQKRVDELELLTEDPPCIACGAPESVCECENERGAA